MIDEQDEIGKGPNCTISLLHHHLSTSSVPGKTLILFSDNCVAQNKNNAVLGYLMWRVARGLNKQIYFNFLLTGHTKFSPDRYFGIFKAKYAISNIDTYEDIKNCVTASSPSGCNKPVTMENVTWYDWVEYFKKFFKPLVGITTFHHFTISKDGVEAKLFADSQDTIKFELRICTDDLSYPNVITPDGLNLERQWYLYKNIRELVFDKKKCDDVAPKPQKPMKKKAAKSEEFTSTENKAVTKKNKNKKKLTENKTETPKKSVAKVEKLPKKTAAVEKAQADVKTRNKDGDKQSIKKRATMVNKSEMKITKKKLEELPKKKSDKGEKQQNTEEPPKKRVRSKKE